MANYIFFLDVDGTLLRNNTEIQQEVIDAAKAFRNAGGEITLSTGRSPISTKWVAEKFDITLPAILYGGASLYDFNQGKHLITHHLKNDILDATKLVLELDSGISVQVYTTEKIFLLHSTSLLRERGVQEEFNISTPAKIEDIYGDILKIVLTCEDPNLLQKCHDTIFTDSDFYFAFSGRRFAEVVAGHVNKAVMNAHLLNKLNIPLSRTFAAGDSMNDYQMMIECAYTFSPINSNSKILELCNETIPVCEEGGVAIAFEKAIKIMQTT